MGSDAMVEAGAEVMWRLAAVLLGAVCAAQPEPGLNPQPAVGVDMAARAVYVLGDAADPKNDNAAVIGFLVAPDVLATARHCIEGFPQLRVHCGQGGQGIILGVIGESEFLDVVLLRVAMPEGERSYLSWAPAPVAPDAPVRVVTRDTRTGVVIARNGTVTAISDCRSGPRFAQIQTTVPSASGTSGSPLLDDQGRVVGLVTSSDENRDSKLARAVPASCIMSLHRQAPVPLATWWRPREVPHGPEARFEFYTGLMHQDATTRVPHLLKAVELNVEYQLAWRQLIKCMWTAGRIDEAIELVQRALATRNESAVLWRVLGQARRHQGDTAGTIAALRRSLAIQRDALTFHELGSSLLAAGKPAEAQAAFGEAAGMEPQELYYRIERAVAQGMQGDHDGALREYDEVLALDPTSSDALRAKSVELERMHRLAEAADAADRYCRLLPTDTASHRRLGNLYAQLGHLEIAVDAYRQALKTSPENEDALFGLGVAYARLGNTQEAESIAQRLEPNAPVWAKVIRSTSARPRSDEKP